MTLTLEEAAAGGRHELSVMGYTTGKTSKLRAHIPQGTTPGQRVRVAGQGGQAQGRGKAGDLFLVVDIRPHSQFRLQRKDLYVRLPVSPWVAVLGGACP